MNCRNSSPSLIEGIILTSLLVVASTAIAFGQQEPVKATQFKLPPGATAEYGLVYAQYGTRQLKLDLYRPSSGKGPFPGIVFIYGGGWWRGNRNSFRRQAAYLATQGFVSATIDYRSFKEAPYPAAVYDCKAAVRWMRANSGKYKIDPRKIAAAGGSSGGHLAALLGTTADVRTLNGDGGNPNFSSRVQAVVAFNGVYDFVSLVLRTQRPESIQNVNGFLGGPLEKVPEVYVEASPVAHVSATSAPFLILHGTGDTHVPYTQALEMQKALQSVGVRADLFSAKGANHGFFNGPEYYEPTLQRMEQFLRSIFGN